VVWDGGGIWLYDGSTSSEIAGSGALPQINNNNLVCWYGSDGSDSEIFVHDGSGAIQITDNSFSDIRPEINDDGWMAWYGGDIDHYEIFFYDGAVITQLTDNDYTDYLPKINNNGWVVWEGNVVTGNSEIFLYDGTSTTELTNLAGNDYAPEINDNGWVVWHGYDGMDSDILLYDGTGISKLTDDTIYSEESTDINNSGYVVWSGEVPTEFSYTETANAEASIYGTDSLTGSGMFNEMILVLIPVGAVIFLRILRSKR
jgi:hypothetical protein